MFHQVAIDDVHFSEKKVIFALEVSRVPLDLRNRVLPPPSAIPDRMHVAYGRSTPSELGDRSI